MEMKWSFKKTAGLKFSFWSDDDMWVFIDGKLVLDQGGIHAQQSASFFVDSVPGKSLVDGQVYDMRIFKVERHTAHSEINITSSIIGAVVRHPPKLLTVTAPVTVRAGDTAVCTVALQADTGLVRNPTGAITWGMVDTSGENPASSLSRVRGVPSLAIFTATKAWTSVKIWAHYVSAADSIDITDTATVAFIPAAPAGLFIETLRNDSP